MDTGAHNAVSLLGYFSHAGLVILGARLMVYTNPLLSILVTRGVFVLTSIIKSYIKEFTV
jgi:hypothetical protein